MKSVILMLLLSTIGRPQYALLDKPPHFIAMEYKGMSNCIYKVYVSDSLIFGAKVNGYITVQPNYGIGRSIPKESMHDPKPLRIAKATGISYLSVIKTLI